ncbi:MAG: bifunctional diaminohydroxyphosphoribosylaminopyrimidine deaminase/5-amino-6-(5-phosphoribosylamino)uracil reductase RibD [Candidatus Peregrinibacteria bacterium]|nr:bifunctional diaminohydroxyphosphoribosylaminopyrimidine deaminase/5-amino-6-(5-phosphoribosylamino)uracil reductase RibD [Candidatus Peregrinibacteria bacterium]MDZ4245122.1 bifunctional diaminohydroxyphosphoribosylaminopyrimidine deaminase/5-amino-6-(5-phosphoribosylamino)uracil reductase RibD [Candidatus Gracilibacteria bacterium]
MQNHISYLQRCLILAKKGEGRATPNPMVGAVLVYKNTVIAEGYHRTFGKSHAEVKAIKNAIRNGHASLLASSTLYVNLEPCSHFGKTPPCIDAIIENKIPHVIIAMQDPNPLVAGKGIEKLKAANIKVEFIELPEAKELNKIFIKNITTGLPYIHLKYALTKDKKLTSKPGTRTKITTKEQDMEVHRLRAQYDAILVGKNTIIIDNPKLTCRLKELTNGKEDGKNPIRIILGTHATLLTDQRFKDFHIFKEAGTTIIATTNTELSKTDLPENTQILICDSSPSGIDLKDLLKKLYSNNIFSILIEGGEEVINSFNKANLTDEQTVYTQKVQQATGL